MVRSNAMNRLNPKNKVKRKEKKRKLRERINIVPWFTFITPLIPFHNIITVIKILNIWTEFPDIQSIKAFIGSDLAGANAASQAF